MSDLTVPAYPARPGQRSALRRPAGLQRRILRALGSGNRTFSQELRDKRVASPPALVRQSLMRSVQPALARAAQPSSTSGYHPALDALAVLSAPARLARQYEYLQQKRKPRE